MVRARFYLTCFPFPPIFLIRQRTEEFLPTRMRNPAKLFPPKPAYLAKTGLKPGSAFTLLLYHWLPEPQGRTLSALATAAAPGSPSMSEGRRKMALQDPNELKRWKPHRLRGHWAGRRRTAVADACLKRSCLAATKEQVRHNTNGMENWCPNGNISVGWLPVCFGRRKIMIAFTNSTLVIKSYV